MPHVMQKLQPRQHRQDVQGICIALLMLELIGLSSEGPHRIPDVPNLPQVRVLIHVLARCNFQTNITCIYQEYQVACCISLETWNTQGC